MGCIRDAVELLAASDGLHAEPLWRVLDARIRRRTAVARTRQKVCLVVDDRVDGQLIDRPQALHAANSPMEIRGAATMETRRAATTCAAGRTAAPVRIVAGVPARVGEKK